MADPQISPIVPVSPQGVRELQKEVAADRAMQIESRENINQYFDLVAFNPLQQAQKFKNLNEIYSKDGKKTEDSKEAEPRVVGAEQVEEASERFQKNNYELNAKTLRILHGQLAVGDTAEEVLEKVAAIDRKSVV